jgi:ABC-type lipoprotein export system ATPase subunit
METIMGKRSRYYNKSTGDIFPPVTDGKLCPLCLQELDESAMQRFIGFEDFIKQDTQQQYNISNERNKQNIKEYESLTFDLINQEPIVKEISELIPEFQSTLDADLLILNGQKEQLINLLNQPNRINEGLKFQLSRQCITSIGQLIAQYSDENQKLSELPFESELIPLELELMELANEKKLSQFKPQISKEIDRRKELKMLNQCYSKCRTNAVTMFSNELASTYVGQSLRDNFQKELVGFGFVNIQIQTETRGARGKQYHYLKLNEITPTNASLKDILSEGEHRCIALSIFLSELTLADHKSAIIFDDPVSSLDHKWRKKIAKRIVEESRIRQVIVFTHDITFLLLVQEYADNFALTLTIKSLTRKKEETGIIAGNPPWDALSVNKRIGQLRSEHQRIDKIERTQTEEEYRENIKPLYGKLRETWERLVEEVLLNGAVQRFGRSIQTQRLSKVVDLQDSDYDIVELNMTKCSTYFNGHDSAGELIEVMPTSTEFLKDIQTIEDYVAEVRKRRK